MDYSLLNRECCTEKWFKNLGSTMDQAHIGLDLYSGTKLMTQIPHDDYIAVFEQERQKNEGLDDGADEI